MSKNSCRSMRAQAQLNSEMPLRKYFLFVGGALLMLLFAADWLTPLPAANKLINSNVKLPVIRIHSERKGPEAVVIDTSKSTIEPTPVASGKMVAPQVVASHKSPLDEAFTDPDTLSPQHADANEQNKTDQGQLQTNRKVMDARVRRPALSHRADSAHVEPLPTRLVHSSPDFREAFAQLVPRPLKQAGRGEPMSRRHTGGRPRLVIGDATASLSVSLRRSRMICLPSNQEPRRPVGGRSLSVDTSRNVQNC